ncbi:MAG: RraA family protein [Blastocatellia bacterium]|nr:RraA family protein [Blastocatellia bacterium]
MESALALFKLRTRNEGVTLPGLLPRVPGLGRLVGYAVTCTFSTDADDDRGRRDNFDYWNYLHHVAGPKVVIALDASAQPATGSTFGQLNANIHRALGCRGVVTNGGIRDIDEFQKLGLHVFAAHLTTRHGNPHFLNFGEAVTLHGATFKTGEVICADEHGVISIPREALPHLEDAVAEIERRLAPVLAYCQSTGFDAAGLNDVINQHMKGAPEWKPKGARKS